MTENAIPIDAKNAITQDVHPYVNIPNTTEKNPKLEALPSEPLSLTMAVEKLISRALKNDMTIFKMILMMTRYNP